MIFFGLQVFQYPAGCSKCLQVTPALKLIVLSAIRRAVISRSRGPGFKSESTWWFFYRFLVCHNCARSKKTKDDALRRPMAIKPTEANKEFRPYQNKNFLHTICSPVASGTDISTVLGSVASTVLGCSPGIRPNWESC